jgi:AcrR family transcriptional regulator
MVKSRREEYADATKQALLDAAEESFASRGFAATSLDDVAAAARVTKGALYHHFENKQALFEAVFLRLSEQMAASVGEVAASKREPWNQALAGIGAFLAMCEEGRYRRIAMEEGPAALGWDRWRELDDPYGYAPLRAALQYLADAGVIKHTSLDMLATMLFGAVSEAAMAVAKAPPGERTAVRRAAERTVATMLGAFRVPPGRIRQR